MPRISVVRESKVDMSARVLQTLGMFDVPEQDSQKLEWKGNLPIEEKDWSIGLIVGPSGCGKTTIATELFGDKIIDKYIWPDQKSILDGFPEDMGIKEITSLLTSVGFGTVPNWLRPYNVLSNGEQFRTHVARAIAESKDIIVIDEFTSVVDRQVAKVASHTVQKTVRRQKKKLIAISCHYDIEEWLQPDWILQPAAMKFQWRSVRPRPELNLRVHKVNKTAWKMFEKYHYMTNALHTSAKCWGGFIDGDCIAFTSVRHLPHKAHKNIMMGHRLVVLPEWQGLGIGGTLDDWLGMYLYKQGLRYHNVVAHPGMIRYYSRSPRWKCFRKPGMLSGGSKSQGKEMRGLVAHQKKVSSQRLTASFVYVPPKEEGAQ